MLCLKNIFSTSRIFYNQSVFISFTKEKYNIHNSKPIVLTIFTIPTILYYNDLNTKVTILIISRSLYNQQHTVEFFRHSWHDAKMINLSSLMKLIEKVTLFEFTEKLLNTLFTSFFTQTRSTKCLNVLRQF